MPAGNPPSHSFPPDLRCSASDQAAASQLRLNTIIVSLVLLGYTFHQISDFKLGSVRLIPHFKLLNFCFMLFFSPTVGWAPADGACSSAALRLQLVIPPLPVGLSVSVVCGHGSHTPLWCSADCNTYIHTCRPDGKAHNLHACACMPCSAHACASFELCTLRNSFLSPASA